MPESLFNKVTSLKPATLLRKETLAQVFSCEFCKIFINTFFTEHLRATASEPLCESSNNWKLVKLKSSVTSKFSKARLKFILVIVQSKTQIVQSMQIVQSAARIIGETVSKQFFKWLLLKVPWLFLYKFTKELYFWVTTFWDLPYHFLSFFINRSSRLRCSVKKLFLKMSKYSQQNTCAGASF